MHLFNFLVILNFFHTLILENATNIFTNYSHYYSISLLEKRPTLRTDQFLSWHWTEHFLPFTLDILLSRRQECRNHILHVPWTQFYSYFNFSNFFCIRNATEAPPTTTRTRQRSNECRKENSEFCCSAALGPGPPFPPPPPLLKENIVCVRTETARAKHLVHNDIVALRT